MNYIENMNADDAITEGRRLTALQLALTEDGDVLATAKAYESYLKGEGEGTEPSTTTA